MHPYLINFGGFKLPTYGFMMAIAYLAAAWYLMKKAKKEKLEEATVSDLIFYTVISGILGAKLFYIGTFWNAFGNSLSEKIKNIFTFETLTAGFVFYGGFICASLTIFFYCRKKKLFFLKIADFLSPALALAHAIGRIGCFSAGCCHGKPTNSVFGVVFSSPYCQVKPEYLNLHIHPTQLYESLGNLLIFAILNLARSKKYFKKEGYVFLSYLALYSILRFCVEFFRGDERGAFALGLSQAQIISALVFFAAIPFIALAAGKEKP